jgi:hypothetical protein
MVRLPLPVYVQAVLLPFEGQIIYDGLLQSYAVVFGPGIRARLNEEYRNAREGIITTLGPARLTADRQQGRTTVLARNARVLQAFRKNLSSKGLSPKTVEQHVGTIEDFAQTSLLGHDPPRGLLDSQAASRAERERMSVAGLNPLLQRRELARHIGVVFGQRSQLWWDWLKPLFLAT